jgi:rhodanese-related sulfurtransferase
MCRSGKRSAAAIMQLEQQGFTNLYNLQGGMLAWAQEIDPTISVY